MAPNTRAFTLVEMIVAVFIFSIVMVIATGSLVSIIGANRKAQAVESIMNSIAFSVDSMTRALRVGTNYECVGVSGCAQSGASAMRFVDVDGRTVTYQLNEDTAKIERSIDGTQFLPLTAPNVVVERLRFYVDGVDGGDAEQPRVLLVIGGYSGSGKSKTTFNIETMVTQRIIDR